MGFLDKLVKKKDAEPQSNVPPPSTGFGMQNDQVAMPQQDQNMIDDNNQTQQNQFSSGPDMNTLDNFPKLELPKFPDNNLNQNSQENNSNSNDSLNSVPDGTDYKTAYDNNKKEQEYSANESRYEKFVNENEQRINDMKRELHKPIKKDTNQDFSDIGNVQNAIKKKITAKGPLFVEINNYKRALDSVDHIKVELSESQNYILRMEEYNDKKTNEFEKWKKCIDYIKSKLMFVDKTLFNE